MGGGRRGGRLRFAFSQTKEKKGHTAMAATKRQALWEKGIKVIFPQ